MTTSRPPFDTTMLAALAVLSVMFALVAFGCDQPPKSDRPEPISVTQPIGTALDDVAAIPPLGEQVKSDAKAVFEDVGNATKVQTSARRIERNADEIIDHARAAERTLTEAKATSLQNDKRVEVLQSHIAKLTADNAKLREQVERERQSGIRKVQLYVGLFGAALIAGGVLSVVKGFLTVGIGLGLGGAVAIGITTFWHQIADVGIGVGIIAFVGGIGWLVYKAGWADDTLRRVTQAIEQVGRANPLAGVRDVKASIAVATDDAFAAIVRDETRPAGK
jgi:hypothetical protein